MQFVAVGFLYKIASVEMSIGCVILNWSCPVFNWAFYRILLIQSKIWINTIINL